jgi:hypothetical protein
MVYFKRLPPEVVFSRPAKGYLTFFIRSPLQANFPPSSGQGHAISSSGSPSPRLLTVSTSPSLSQTSTAVCSD